LRKQCCKLNKAYDLWRVKTQDRKEWSAILREAKAKLKGYDARVEKES
jgi:hypothetical protein